MIAKTLATTLSTDKKREQLLNKFLTKTFYMITECDPSVASWSSDGNSFTVRDIKRFESEYLPKYFNHRRFASFVRQLNFYSFVKVREDRDLQINRDRQIVRFSHRYFKRGQIDLLHQIKRTTAGKSVDETSNHTTGDLEAVKIEMSRLSKRLDDLEAENNAKLAAIVSAMETKFQLQIRDVQTYYESIIRSMLLHQAPTTTL